MGKVRAEIPYDENKELLSFVTDASTVYYGEVTLKKWLDNLKKDLLAVAANSGIAGDSFKCFETYYGAFSEEDNNYAAVSAYTLWSEDSPALSKSTPHLWKKLVTVKLVKNKEERSASYLYCGSLGKAGLDSEWREWVFRIIDASGFSSESKIEELLLAELDADAKSKNFLDNDHVPENWSDDMQELPNDKYLQWCASRDKKNTTDPETGITTGVWSPFGNLHVFGRISKLGVGNNIYAVTDEIDSLKWEEDAAALKASIKLDTDSGTIINFPVDSALNYKWVDSVPNAESGKIIYLATAYFLGVNCIKIDEPIRITGPDGVPGVDGTEIEFVYCSSASNDISELPTFTPTEQHYSGGELGKWCDTASLCPISPSAPYLFMRQRRGKYINENNWYWYHNGQKFGKSTDPDSGILTPPASWNYGWSEPSLWSSWGQDGVDGDGVQYVFLQLTEEEYKYVMQDWSRWNFDGEPSETDPGDSASNYTYTYTFDKDSYVYDELLEYNATRIYLTGITITRYAENITTGSHKVKVFKNQAIWVFLPEGEVNNENYNKTYENYVYNCLLDDLPENNGTGKANLTITYTRKYKPSNSVTCFIHVQDRATSTPIKSSLIVSNNEGLSYDTNPVTITLDKSETKSINAPTVIGYELDLGDSTITLSSSNLTAAFYYKKVE